MKKPGQNLLIIKLTLLLIFLSFSFGDVTGQIAKYSANPPVRLNTVDYDSVIIDIGQLQNFVGNQTRYFSFDVDPQTFRIGRDDFAHPSMMWGEGGYANNHYLFSGMFWIGYNQNTVRFNTSTSNDFTVFRVVPGQASPFRVSFSMTDEPETMPVGIKCRCVVYAWPEPLRDDFMIYEYHIINRNPYPLNDVYAAMNLDFDISTAGAQVAPHWFDDQVAYYSGIGLNGIPESISYMYDGDNPSTPGNDTGGYLSEKESSGYAGSRILFAPETKNGIRANQQSGHWSWNSQTPLQDGPAIFNQMQSGQYAQSPIFTGDHRFLQTVGPWDIGAGDSVTVAFALGIGEGLDGMRRNLQIAYELYWFAFRRSDIPRLTVYEPAKDVVFVTTGEEVTFRVGAEDDQGDSLIYTWRVDNKYQPETGQTFGYDSKEFTEATHIIRADVSDGKMAVRREWIVSQTRPKVFDLGQNYPNPFNGITTIPFETETAGLVTISVYNLSGEKVVTLIREKLPPGQWEARWDGTTIEGIPVSSGFYLYRLEVAGFISYKKMLYLR